MNRLLVLALVALAAAPAVALAAPRPGSYSGTSSAKYIQVGQTTEPTDKGKVTFTVRGNKVLNLRLREQLIQCGPPAEVPLTVKTITLNSSGKGTATYTNPNVGQLNVSITVRSNGTASGTIRRPASATGLCNPDYPVRFTAKRT
ncbi:MAG: hypothetical protein QOF04_786 [Solirubrobacteraceae bacterium]|jgi:hypothetical protein|nr:hypothetical protein [Solirubrobacteraceae bacterium]